MAQRKRKKTVSGARSAATRGSSETRAKRRSSGRSSAKKSSAKKTAKRRTGAKTSARTRSSSAKSARTRSTSSRAKRGATSATASSRSRTSAKATGRKSTARKKTAASTRRGTATARGRSAGGSKTAQITTDHDEIRRWAEERNAQPACVRRTGGNGDIGMIRLDFPGYSGETSLEHISWDEWFDKFEESNLALLHQETTARGQKSNFNKLIGRETAAARQRGEKASRRSLRGRRGSEEEGGSSRRKAA